MHRSVDSRTRGDSSIDSLSPYTSPTPFYFSSLISLFFLLLPLPPLTYVTHFPTLSFTFCTPLTDSHTITNILYHYFIFYLFFLNITPSRPTSSTQTIFSF
ncbi:hypothetical protein CsSME_00014133 [Camellia sinensis var. sinensis]